MKLLERYATACGLSIDDIGGQHLLEQFYPLPFERYIVLHASSGMAGKNYPHYSIVVELIKPYLAAQNIEIVQLGIKEDPAINGCYHTMGKTSPHQANYIISRALLTLGNDSLWQHRAGHLGKPIVELFATTSEANHSPYDYDETKTTFISSHRWGRNPTFAAQEPQSTANLICPFAVARAVLDLLEIPHTITQKTLNIGGAYNASLLELVPNVVPDPNFNPHVPMAVRFDLEPNEPILIQLLQTGRKINLLVKTFINLNVIATFKQSLASLNFEITENTSVDYVAALKKIYPTVSFFTRSQDKDSVAALRFKFFDVITIQQVTDKSRTDFERAIQEYTNDKSFSLDSALKAGKMEFKTNKFVLSNGKIYTSMAHAKADIPVNTPGANKVMDCDDWIHDQNHYMVFENK